MIHRMLLLVACAGAVSAICPTEGPSFDRVAGTPYACSSSTTSDVHLYWTVEGGSVHMALAVQDVSGWVSLSFPTTRGTMVPAEAVSGYGTMVGRQRVTARNPSGVAADNTVLTDVSNMEISTLTIGGSSYRVLRFTRTVASIPSATLSVNYAYHSTSNTFPADRHTTRGGWKADLPLDIPCTPSSNPDFQCQMSVDSRAMLHWAALSNGTVDAQLVVSQNTAGWAAVGFPSTGFNMIGSKALVSDGMVYDLNGKNPSLVVPATDMGAFDSTYTTVMSGDQVLRFTTVVTPGSEMNLVVAYHTTSSGFPVARHEERFGVEVLITSTPTPTPPPAVVTPPSCTPSSNPDFQCQMSVDSRAMLHWAALSNGTVDAQLVVSQNTAGWAAVGFPSTGFNMIGSKALVSDGMVYDLNGKNPSLVVPATDMGSFDSTYTTVMSGDQVLRFTTVVTSGSEMNLVVAYHTTSSGFPVARHEERFGVEVLITSTPMPTPPPAVVTPPSCTPSSNPDFQCQMAVDSRAMLHWAALSNGTVDAQLVVSQNTAGWAAVGFPSTGFNMIGSKALVSDGMVYDLNGKNPSLVVPATDMGAFDSTYTTVMSGDQVLRFTTVVTPGSEMNLVVAYHTTSSGFPVARHEERFGVEVLITSTPTPTPPPAVVTPPSCTPSSNPDFQCQMSVDSRAMLHWAALSNGTVDAQLVVSQNTAGWAAVGFPSTGFNMIGSKALVSDGMVYDLNGKNPSLVVPATDMGAFDSTYTTVMSGDQVLRFTTVVTPGSEMNLVVAYHTTSSGFPVARHEERFGVEVLITSTPMPTPPPAVVTPPSCTPSSNPDFQCQMSVNSRAMLHWAALSNGTVDAQLVVSQNTAGWAAVGFPSTGFNMIGSKALVSDGMVYDLNGKNPSLVVPATDMGAFDSTYTTVMSGDQVLRFTTVVTPGTEMNLVVAYHTTSSGFPVARHEERFGVEVLITSTPTPTPPPAVVTPPSCTPSSNPDFQCQMSVDSRAMLHWAALSNGTVDAQLVVSQNTAGWAAVGFPSTGFNMIGSKALVSDGMVYDLNGKNPSLVVPATDMGAFDSTYTTVMSGDQVLRFTTVVTPGSEMNLVVAYHTTSSGFPVARHEERFGVEVLITSTPTPTPPPAVVTPPSCTPSSNPDFQCQMSVDSRAMLHWAALSNGTVDAQLVVSQNTAGWAAVGFPSTGFNMIGSKALVSDGMVYDLNGKNPSLVVPATDMGSFDSTYTTVMSGDQVLRFTTAVTPGSEMNLVVAYHTTSSGFPVARHEERFGVEVLITSTPTPTPPPAVVTPPSCTPSSNPDFQCQMSVDSRAMLHWAALSNGTVDAQLVVSQNTAGWAAVGFPSTGFNMIGSKALVSDGMVYDLNGKNPSLVVPATDMGSFDSTYTTVMSGDQVLRFTTVVTSGSEMNLVVAYHTTSSGFPVARHEERFGVEVLITSTPMPTPPPAVVTPPSCTPSSNPDFQCQMAVDSRAMLHWAALSNGTVDAQLVVSQNTAGWAAVGFPSTGFNMIGSKALVSDGMVYDLNGKNPSLVVPATDMGSFDSTYTTVVSGNQVLRFTTVVTPGSEMNLVVAYHTTSSGFPVARHEERFGVEVLITSTPMPTPPPVVVTPPSCTPSSNPDFQCQMAVDSRAMLHWAALSNGTVDAQLVVSQNTAGWAAVGFPSTGFNMIGSKALVSDGMVYDLNGKNPSLVVPATDMGAFDSTSSTVVSGDQVLRFSTNDGGNSMLNLVVAYHTTSSGFPVARHEERFGVPIPLTAVPSVPVPTQATPDPSGCATPSPLPDFQCMMVIDAKATLHWTVANDIFDAQVVVSSNTAGWAAVGLPSNGLQMIGSKALVSDGMVYDLNGKSAALVVRATDMGSFATTSATVVSGDQVLRFSTSLVGQSSAEVRLVVAYHRTSTAFPVYHDARFGVRVPTGRAVTPPATPVPSAAPRNNNTPVPTGCTPSTRAGYQCQQVVDAKAALHWNPLANGTVDAILVVSGNSAGWSAVGLPSSGTSMVGAKALVSDGKVYDLNGRSAGAVVATTDNGAFNGAVGTAASSSFRMAEVAQVSGEQLLRFSTDVGATGSLNLIVSYHGTSAAFPVNKHDERYGLVVATNGGAQVTTFDDNTEKAKTHGGVMVTVWAYVVPCAILLKRFGTEPLGMVGQYPVAFIMHGVLMLGSAITTTIFFGVALSEFDGNAGHGHKDLGIALVVVIWVQVVLGIVAPPKDSALRFPFVISHTLLGVGSFGMSIGQMVAGLRNMEDLYTDTIRDNLLIAMIVGLVFFAVAFLVLTVVMVVLAKPVEIVPVNNSADEGGNTGERNRPYE